MIVVSYVAQLYSVVCCTKYIIIVASRAALARDNLYSVNVMLSGFRIYFGWSRSLAYHCVMLSYAYDTLYYTLQLI